MIDNGEVEVDSLLVHNTEVIYKCSAVGLHTLFARGSTCITIAVSLQRQLAACHIAIWHAATKPSTTQLSQSIADNLSYV
jgi:hypothetical protein